MGNVLSGTSTPPASPSSVNKAQVDEILTAMIGGAGGVSDLIFVVGKPPHVEAYGKLQALDSAPVSTALTAEKIEEIVDCVLNGNERLRQDYITTGSCDCSYTHPSARFRVNIYRQNGNPAIVMRILQSEIPSLQKLGLPPIFSEIIKERNGIIFLTGGTGSGKTTTLAAMLNELNETRAIHIVTLEDPVEFLHPHKSSIFSQRELGKDFYNFPTGLRAALRQAPKVILVGEIRDRETMDIAMTAAETGHVVFSTLHTINAGQSITRVLGMYSQEEEPLVRQRLAETLRYVVSQRLVSKTAGGRHLITEIMGSNLSTREAILHGERENRSFQEIIEAATTSGWHSFDQDLLKAYESDLITEETAMLYCTIRNKMSRELDAVKKRRTAHIEAPSGFKLHVAESAPPPKIERVAAAIPPIPALR